MSILNSVIKIFVGDKQQKDLKILQPIVEKVTAYETTLSSLSNDELRNKTTEFKKRIKEGTKVFNDKITALEKEAKYTETLSNAPFYNAPPQNSMLAQNIGIHQKYRRWATMLCVLLVESYHLPKNRLN